RGLGLNTFKKRGEFAQRIISANLAVKFATIVNQIEGHLQLALFDAIERLDLAGVDDGGVETCGHRFMKKDRVEYDARCRIQAERDIRNTEDRKNAGQFSLDAPDTFNRFERVTAIFFNARRDRQRQRVKEDIVR